MKLQSMADKGLGRKPLRTTAELAAEFGISARRLAAILRHTPGAPKPELKNHGLADKTWYSPEIVRPWLRAYFERTQNASAQQG